MSIALVHANEARQCGKHTLTFCEWIWYQALPWLLHDATVYIQLALAQAMVLLKLLIEGSAPTQTHKGIQCRLCHLAEAVLSPVLQLHSEAVAVSTSCRLVMPWPSTEVVRWPPNASRSHSLQKGPAKHCAQGRSPAGR